MSLAADIRGGVKAVVAGLTLTGTPGVVERKRPVFRKGDPVAGVLCVSGVDLGAEPLTAEDASAVEGRYGVQVTAIRPNAAAENAPFAAEEWAEDVAAALHKPNPLPAVAAVMDVDRQTRPWLSVAGLERDYDVAAVALVFRTREARA